MISRGYINLLHIETKYNFIDILTKHLGYQGTYYKLIHSVFHHEGNTAALFLGDTLDLDVSIDDNKTIFGILGSDRTFPQPQEFMLVVGQTIVRE